MKGSRKVGTIAGVPIRLHWSLVILVIFAIGPGMTASKVVSEAAWIVAVFACVLVHELAHSLLARHRGYKVRDVVLMPLGGFSEIIGISNSPGDEAMISLVGPLANFTIAALLAIAAASSRMEMWPPTLFARAWLVRILWANVALGALNLLPALPLDGGRVLRGLLGRSRNRAQATAIAARTATTIATLMIVAGLVVDLWMALIGLFVFFGARAEQQMAAAGELLRGLKVRDAMVTDTWGLDAAESLEEAAPLLRQFPNRAFAVVDDGKLVGVIAASDLVTRPGASTVRDDADTVAPWLHADDDVYPTALDAFTESGRKSLPVEEDGRPAGMLYVSDLESRLRRRQSRVIAERRTS
jgi:Zn-dependent protease